MVYVNYRCPFCGKIFYIKRKDLVFEYSKSFNYLSLNNVALGGLFGPSSRHKCINNDINQFVLLSFLSISEEQLPDSEEFKE